MRDLTVDNEAVRWFAERMLRKLAVNRHKEHWHSELQGHLFVKLVGEVEELRFELNREKPRETYSKDEREKVIDEAADVANFAMMIAHNAREALSTREKTNP